ncbi:unnamed protein product [Thlaspi arvense]|uniref:Transmembrane protein n=1 Tax=Thlaspi arvense TaxID=13288 RepID=A0AAU9R8I5_THLAR|nr:unnamed protein product [Thlaspi arvense]
MEVPVINRISDFDVGINSINHPSFLSRAFHGKLHHAYSFLKWGALLLIAFVASFTTLITRLRSLVVLRLRNADVSLPSPTLLYDYDSDSDSSCSSDSSDDEEDEDYDDDKEDDSVNGGLRVKRSGYFQGNNDDEKGINGNIPWMRRCSGSFGDLLSWPDLGGLGSSGVVKLWDHLDINGERSRPAEKKGFDAVEVSAWDARIGFVMPALIAEWTQPGRLLGNVVRVNGGDVDKIYVGGEITVGDMRI